MIWQHETDGLHHGALINDAHMELKTCILIEVFICHEAWQNSPLSI